MSIAQILLKLQNVAFADQRSSNILDEVVVELIQYDKARQAHIDKLNALEAAGVDNWEGYDEAMRELYGDEEDDDE